MKNNSDIKFILILEPKMHRYLEWASGQKRMHKAQIVRNAVEKKIEKDKEYQQYLDSDLNLFGEILD